MGHGSILKKCLLTATLGLATIVVGSLPFESVKAQDAAVQGPSVDEALRDVTTKFRFREIYSTKGVEPIPGEINQTRNAFKETLAMTVDSPKGAPIKSERTRQLIYSERPGLIGPNNRIDAVVRRFETFRFDPAPQGLDAEKKPPLEGLTIYAARAQEGENVMSLVENRPITNVEYQVATSVPTILNFYELLPTVPLRIGDSWSLTRTAARQLVGRGKVSNSTLSGKLDAINQVPGDDSQLSALISISGQVITDLGTCSLNMQYQFEFPKQAVAKEIQPAFGTKDPGPVLAAPGGIKKMSLAQVEISDLPGSQGRLKQVFDRKLVFERQLAGRQTPIELPSTIPTPTKQNSWLVFEDPENRFKLLHPPSFRPRVEDEDSIMFVTMSTIPEFIRLDLDAGDIKPEGLRQDLEREWKAEGFQIFAVTENYLDEKTWGNRRVYRVEAALQATDTGSKQRGHFDAYVMQFPQNTTYVAESLTYSDRSTQFRDLVEEILQTIELGIPTAPVEPAAAPATPADPAPAPAP